MKAYDRKSDIDMFVPNTDRTHLARALECVTKSTLTSELVNMLLNFNPWQISKVLHIKYVVTMHGPAFLRWLEGQVSHKQSPFLIIDSLAL